MMLSDFEISEINVFDLPSVPLDQRSQLPNVSGVYFAVRNEDVLYVGRASNLRARWARNNHHRLYELDILGGIFLHWLEVDTSACDIAELEGNLIKYFDPPVFNSSPVKDRRIIELEERVRQLEQQMEAGQYVKYVMDNVRKSKALLSRFEIVGGLSETSIAAMLKDNTGDHLVRQLERSAAALREAASIARLAQSIVKGDRPPKS